LESYAGRHDKNPWPHYLMMVLLKAEGQSDRAGAALEAFERLCEDDGWLQRAAALMATPCSQPGGSGS